MNEQKNNGRGVFYGVIGVATLVVAIIGATFAYFTATASNSATITGNMATINFGLQVDQMTSADDRVGMIPMSNSMVEAAVTSKKGICVDNNGNVVCQVYRAKVINTGSAALYLDGYVSLYGGSGVPTDNGSDATNNTTTMRWAQVLCTEADDGNSVTSCSTQGKTTTGAGLALNGQQTAEGITINWDSLAAPDEDDGTADAHNDDNVLTTGANVTVKASYAGNDRDYINRNYIRISDHAEGDISYDREDDVTSALVFNQPLNAAGDENNKDKASLYFVVWLSETGTNQTADSTGAGAFQSTDANSNDKIDDTEKGVNFFKGNVVFNSAQGSEVTATFSGFATVTSDALQ